MSHSRAASLLAPPSDRGSAPRFDSERTLAYLERMLLADASLGDASLMISEWLWSMLLHTRSDTKLPLSPLSPNECLPIPTTCLSLLTNHHRHRDWRFDRRDHNIAREPAGRRAARFQMLARGALARWISGKSSSGVSRHSRTRLLPPSVSGVRTGSSASTDWPCRYREGAVAEAGPAPPSSGNSPGSGTPPQQRSDNGESIVEEREEKTGPCSLRNCLVCGNSSSAAAGR